MDAATRTGRTEILRLASLQRRRLNWRQLTVLALALVTMSVCASGIIADLSPTTSHRLHDPTGNTHATLAVWAAVYLGAALAAAAANARFDLGCGLGRLPLVLVVGSVGILVFLVGRVALHGLTGGGESAAGGDGPDANDSGAHAAKTPRGPASLAAALFEPGELTAALGAPADPAASAGRSGRNTCSSTYRAREGSGSLTVVIRARPRRLSPARAESIIGLGDAAFAYRHTLWCSISDWALIVAGTTRGGEPLDQESLIALARAALARLPTPAEIAQYERASGLFARTPRGLLNGALAAVGIDVLPARS
jgi:hypothetical protein